jgi:hypothetical protein
VLQSNWDASGVHSGLDVSDTTGTEVENTSRENRIGMALKDAFGHVLGIASAAAGNDGNGDSVRNRPQHR